MDHVFIVEDHEENRNLLKMLLEANGYRVTVAGDGMEALAAAKKDPPDAIVSDVLMPRMDGFALCRAWMQDTTLRHIPFIFYSATYVHPDDERFAMALGAVRYLIKPLEVAVFLRELRAVLQQWAGRAVPGPAAPLEEAAAHELHETALARKLEDKLAQLDAANRKLRECEEKCRRIYDNLQDVYVETGMDGTILEVNPQVATLSKGQYRREDLIGTSVNALYADSHYRDAVLQAIKQRGRAIDVETMLKNRDGSLVPCSVSATVVREADGELRTIAALRDITGRKEAERALIEAETRYRSVVEQWFAGIFVIQDQKFAYCNPRLVRMLGYGAEAELTGRDPMSVVAGKDAAATARALGRLLEEQAGPSSHAFSAVRKDGAIVELELQGVRATYGGRPAIIGMIREIAGK